MELHQNLNYIAVLLAEESSLHYVKQLGIRISVLLTAPLITCQQFNVLISGSAKDD